MYARLYFCLTRKPYNVIFVKTSLCMSYNRKNILQRMIDIQNLVLEHKARGVTQEWVYSNLVYPTYKISRRTFYDYLGTNAKAELKRMVNAENLQMSMW